MELMNTAFCHFCQQGFQIDDGAAVQEDPISTLAIVRLFELTTTPVIGETKQQSYSTNKQVFACATCCDLIKQRGVPL